MIVPLVEGHSELRSLRILVDRIAAEWWQVYLPLARPIRVPRYGVVRPGELERAVELAVARRPGCSSLLILLDADDDAPCLLGPQLQTRAQAARPDLPVQVILANRELESWLIAGVESLRGQFSLPNDVSPPADPEAPRDAKGWLNRRMRGTAYHEVDDQPRFAASFDLRLAYRNSRSFRKFVEKLDRLRSAIGR